MESVGSLAKAVLIVAEYPDRKDNAGILHIKLAQPRILPQHDN